VTKQRKEGGLCGDLALGKKRGFTLITKLIFDRQEKGEDKGRRQTEPPEKMRVRKTF